MTQEHPITPSTELVKQWLSTYFGTTITGEVSDVELVLATQAARWGSDQELEACCEYLEDESENGFWSRLLRAARRPKPPSLKEQALAVLDHTQKGYGLAEVDLDTIRRALEQLDD